LSGPACLVTFDDAWIDTWTEAWPVLQRFKVPAIVFVPVNYIGSTRRFWQEQLGHDLFRIWTRGSKDREFQEQARTILAPYDLEGVLQTQAEQVRATIADLVAGKKHLPPEEIRAMVDNVSALSGTGTEGAANCDGFMNWTQIRELAAHVIAFGGHGAEHVILTNVPIEEARREIKTAERVLREQLGCSATAFSYPNGNWNSSIAEAVKDAGYRVAFTTGTPDASAPYAFRRFNVHQDMTSYLPLFLARVVGVLR
jgi:peptidoglycan/xylan/chitin deacetylase (PgdA/CDA1 family)